jgi:hypothetical protein
VVNLQAELENIKQAYQNDLAKNTVEFKDALNLIDVTQLDQNRIIVDGDRMLDKRKLKDRIYIELLNAQGRDENETLIVNALNSMNSSDKVIKGVSGFTGAKNGFNTEDIGSPWTNGIVYYQWDQTVSDRVKEQMKLAMNSWSSNTKIIFKEIDNNPGFFYSWFEITQENHVLIQQEDLSKDNDWGNTSLLGMKKSTSFFSLIIGGETILSIDSNLAQQNGVTDLDKFINNIYLKNTCIHELGHVLGLLHEHARSDRNQNIDIGNGADELVSQKIKTGRKTTWTLGGKKSYDIWETQAIYHGEYDCFSMMHYSNANFINKSGKYILQQNPKSQTCQDYITQYNRRTGFLNLKDVTQTLNVDLNSTPHINFFMNSRISKLDREAINKIYK